jgi:hypothetical protein
MYHSPHFHTVYSAYLANCRQSESRAPRSVQACLGSLPLAAACSPGGDGEGRRLHQQSRKAWLNKFPIRFVRIPETSRECAIGARLP